MKFACKIVFLNGLISGGLELAGMNDSKVLQLRVRLELSDLKSYYYWSQKNTFFNDPLNIMVLVVTALSLVRGITSGFYAGTGLIATVGTLFLISRWIWRFIYINKVAKKIYCSDKTILKEQMIELTETTITIRYGESVQKFNWDEVYSVRETEKQFLIFTAINKAFIIPKRFIDNNEELPLLREITKKALPKKKTKMKKGQ